MRSPSWIPGLIELPRTTERWKTRTYATTPRPTYWTSDAAAASRDLARRNVAIRVGSRNVPPLLSIRAPRRIGPHGAALFSRTLGTARLCRSSSPMPRSQTTHAATRRAILLGGVGLAAGAAAACTTTREDRTADGFAELSDQRGSVSPIRADERAARRRRLGTILAGRGLDAMLMEGGATMTYLSGGSWGRSERFFGLVVLADASHFWISPAFH